MSWYKRMLEHLVREWEAGAIEDWQLYGGVPDGCRVEVQPAVVLLWSHAAKMYVARVRRAA